MTAKLPGFPDAEIFKLQRPIVTNRPDQQILVYNKDRSKIGQFGADTHVMKLFGMGLKVFLWGTWNPETGQIELHKEAPWQKW